nr:pyruvate ferredoxin oxidoreductase [Candidatus Sabulitectum sp.]
RDYGWIHLYCEDAQEAYDTAIMAVRLSEHNHILTPVFVCQDGFITSHGFEPVEYLDDNAVKAFVGERKPQNALLDIDNPVTYGSFAMSEYYFEIKRQQVEAHKNALALYDGIARDFEALSGRYYPMLDCYRTEDADHVIVIMSSASGAVKDVVDEMRDQGHKVGCLRIRMFRPFPASAVVEALRGKKSVAVLDRCLSIGGTAPLVAEIRSALYASGEMIPISSCIYGLGGRDFFPGYAEEIFMDLIKGRITPEERYIGLLE